MKTKNKIIYISVILMSILCLSVFFIITSVHTDEPAPEWLDLNIDNELSQREDVYNAFEISADEVSSAGMLSMAGPYIPEGAICTDVSVDEAVIYIDYRLDNVRYIVAYYEDGTVEKTARETGSADIYSIDSNSYRIEHEKVK